MRQLPVLLAFLALIVCGLAAEPKLSSASSATNTMVILCSRGAEFSAAAPPYAIYHGEVRVLYPQMYLECELLTVFFRTNNPTPTAEASATNAAGGVETIVAETNLLIMARDTTILGDRAVYTASNEVVVVTGDLVVIQIGKVLQYQTNFVYNRATGSGYAVGWTATEIEPGAGSGGTNALKSLLGPGRKARPSADDAKPPDEK